MTYFSLLLRKNRVRLSHPDQVTLLDLKNILPSKMCARIRLVCPLYLLKVKTWIIPAF